MAEMVVPKPVERQSWPLADRAGMFDALDELAPQGWRGGITCDQDGVWRIELNHSSGAQVVAAQGSRLVLEPFGGLAAITSEQFDDFFEAAS